MGRIIDRTEIRAVRAETRAEKRCVVFTNGCFDILHRGHVELLFKASLLGDFLVVGLNTDDSVRRLKGEGRPVTSQEDRAFILANLDMVDCVTLFDEDTPDSLIKEWEPDVLVKGGDYDPAEIVGRDFVESRGGLVKVIPLVDGYSTSHIIERMAGGASGRMAGGVSGRMAGGESENSPEGASPNRTAGNSGGNPKAR